jgi:hypothetical protein
MSKEIKYKDAVPNSIVSRYREESAYMKAFPKFVTVSEQTRLNVLKMILTEEEYEQVVELYEKEKTLKKHRGVGGDE